MSKTQEADDEKDAKRWRAVCQRHGMAMMRLATGSGNYHADTKQKILDTWADMAAAEIEEFDPDVHWQQVANRIKELEQEFPELKELP